MLKEKFKILIKEFHESSLPHLVKRHQSIDLTLFETPLKKVITVTGPRRAGKTYFFFQIMKTLISKGEKKENILYINFEDERILPMTADDLHLLIDAYSELYGSDTRPLIFLDEIQNIEGWERFVRRLNDHGYYIFITGSNSRLLSREIATALRGRTINYEIFPFSFAEFLAAKGVVFQKNHLFGKKRHKIKKLFEDYFYSGGFPELAFVQEKALKTRILQDYFSAVFYRDLIERYNIKNSELLRRWLNVLIANTATLISFSKIENDFKSQGIKVSKATLASFARYIKDVYFGFFVEMYSDSVRKRQANPRKFYLIDQGIHNHLTFKFSENKGRILENLVFTALRRREHYIYYYKTKAGYEVDFFIRKNGKTSLIQVCYDLTNLDTYHSEKKALVSAMKELNVKVGLIITLDEKRNEKIQGRSITTIPVMEWLLTPDDNYPG